MLHFMYEGSYYRKDVVDNVSSLCFHAAMAGLGDKYSVPNLVKYAVKAFRYRLFDDPERHYIINLLREVSSIYDLLPETNRSLRDPIVHLVVREYFLTRRGRESFREIASEVLEDAVQTHPHFAKDIVKAFNMLDPVTYLFSDSDAHDRDDSGRLLCNHCGDVYNMVPSRLRLELYWNYYQEASRYPYRFTCDECQRRESSIEWHGYEEDHSVHRRRPDDHRPFFYLPKAPTAD